MDTCFEVGQTVYCAMFGKGIVTHTSDDSAPDYPIRVKFSNDTIVQYTVQGQYIKNTKPVLSQNPIPEIVNKPMLRYDLSFIEALDAVTKRAKVNCQQWLEKESYIALVDSKILPFKEVMLHEPGYMPRLYIINELDIKAKWRIV